ncbi:MAG: TauD/TfdA family dioxygenase [Alphaproteobacteria bacterium]|nr:TauD/TfdA family dioxygenase [Alphaproteobacteria bacterium]
MAALEIAAIEGGFAHEARGLQLWQSLDAATLAALALTWRRHGVLLFRRQALSEDELVAFSAAFGRPEVIVRADWQGNRPEVTQISNMKNQAGRSIGGLGAGELGWHTDQSYMSDPATGALLYMVEMPPEGGLTYWANLRLAYAALPQATKERIEPLSAVYDYAKRQATYDDEKPMSAELRAKTPPVMHPLVNIDPVTGDRSLYLDPTTTVGIEGLAPEAGEALLGELAAHATRPEFVYCHHWQMGDLVMWDNGFLLHRRDPFDMRQNRLLKRTTLRLAPVHHVVPASRPAVARVGK